MRDLFHAKSRPNPIRLVRGQGEQIADLERRLADQADEVAALRATIAQLSARVGDLLAGAADGDEPPDEGARPRGMPGLKPTQEPGPARRVRRHRAHGFTRRRMVPTARVVHALGHCPTVARRWPGDGQANPRGDRGDAAPVVVTEHVYLERRCPGLPPPLCAAAGPGGGGRGSEPVRGSGWSA